MKAHVHSLTQLQYSTDRRGPFKLYVYRPDGFHEGGVWFRPAPKYPDEEITVLEAEKRTLKAIAEGREVRICDGGDMLVFHAKGGKILHRENFFQEVS
jgi:hypothetical protein